MNEFVARNGLIALDSSSISGPLTVSGSVSISGSNLTVSAPGFYNTTFRNTGQSVYNTYEPTGFNSWIVGVETDYFAVYSGRNVFYLNRSRSSGNSYLNSDYFRFGAADAATAQVDIAGSSTARASLRIRSGSAPTSPNDGDIWNSGSILYLKSGLETSGSLVVTGSSTFNGNVTLLGNISSLSFGGAIQAGNTFSFYSSNGNINATSNLSISITGNGGGVNLSRTGNTTLTSGNANFLAINSTGVAFAPTSGDATMNSILIIPVISQSGGANGITRGISIVPTLTSAWDFRAIEWSNNASATSGSWGLYGSGSAPNFINGSLGIGTTSLAYGSAGNSAGKLTINNSSGNNGLVIRNGDGGYQVNIKTTTNDSIGTEFVWYDGGTATFLQYAGGLGARLGLSTSAQFRSNNDSSATIHTGGSATERFRVASTGNIGIGTTSPTYKLDINGSFRSSGSITATSGSDYFDISHDITQPAQTGSQIYEVNITPTLRYTAPNQTQTALRVAATFSGSTALSSSQSNIIADFGSTSAGSQFLVNDVTSGSIYMVNDVSGLPIIEANSNWDVMIYDYPNVVLKKTGSTIEISGSLKLNGSSLDTGWTAYTPFWTTDGGTQPVLNNGSLTGAYKQIGKTVFVRVKFNPGTTTTFGSGAFQFSLPISASSPDGIQFPCSILNNGLAWYQGTVNGTYTGAVDKSSIIAQSSGGANSSEAVTATHPFTFGSADSIQFNGSYEIA
jgi:hypothetical protein